MAFAAPPQQTRRLIVGGLIGLGASFVASQPLFARDYRYGVVLPDNGDEYFKAMLAGIQEASDQAGSITLSVQGFKDAGTAVAAVQGLMESKADGLLVAVSAGEQPIFDDLLRRATEAGVPSVAINREVPSASASVVPDRKAVGLLQAQAAMSGAAGGGTILYVTGPRGLVDPALEQGFRAGIDTARFKVAIIHVDSLTADEAANQTLGVLSVTPDIVAVVVLGGGLAEGAARALEKAGLQVPVIGAGAVDLKPAAQGATALRTVDGIVRKGVCPNGQNPPCPTQWIQPQLSQPKDRK